MSKATESTTNSSASGTESERIAQVIHDALDRFTVHAAEAEQRVKDAAADARTKLKDSKQAASKNATQAGHAVEDYVERHPWAALGAAFGAGIIIAALMRR